MMPRPILKIASFLQGETNINSFILANQRTIKQRFKCICFWNKVISNRYVWLLWFRSPSAQVKSPLPHLPLNSSHFVLGTAHENICTRLTREIMQHRITLSHWNKEREHSQWLLYGIKVLKIIKSSILNPYCWWKETYIRVCFLT